ncbi:uncharacterized protein [Rutidosis leptorrhynchoides]|uniref:uncharacterized protein n=1 Tax=Rutidosis leptorrhynchoides TaxID=125765 RepID=UPI003A98D26C
MGWAKGELEDLVDMLNHAIINPQIQDGWRFEVFVWRARKGRLLIRTELDKRGIDLHSVLCPLCDGDVESVDHSLLSCEKVCDMWNKVFNWREFNRSTTASLNDLLQCNTPHIATDSGKSIWQALIWTSGYLIWKNRNQVVFKNKGWSSRVALSEIQIKSFEWIAKRIKGINID